jgi:hypothetical protein
MGMTKSGMMSVFYILTSWVLKNKNMRTKLNDILKLQNSGRPEFLAAVEG